MFAASVIAVFLIPVSFYLVENFVRPELPVPKLVRRQTNQKDKPSS